MVVAAKSDRQLQDFGESGLHVSLEVKTLNPSCFTHLFWKEP